GTAASSAAAKGGAAGCGQSSGTAARSTEAAEAAEAAERSAKRAAARDGVHVVVAGNQSPDTVLALVVGLSDAGRREAPFALQVLIAHHPHHHARHRFAVFVQHAAADYRSARELELNAFERLTVRQLQRRSGLQRTSLAVRERHESRLRHGQGVTAR